MYAISEITALIEQGVADAGFPNEPVGLYDPARYILSAGGKRIRPLLAMLGAQVFTDDLHPHIPVAVSMEVFHNFTLVHDDIMDNAPVRRGLPTVHEKWGTHTAILSGDAMLIQAYVWMCKLMII
jgi:geranylgeranyl diphosphate synthase type II